MHRLDQLVHVFRLDLLAEALGLQVVLHALLAARHLEQLVVVVHVPIEIVAEFLEGHVEGHAVTVALGVDDHSVLVEKYCFDL